MVSIQDKNRIQTKLLRWFERNKRDLPWRRTRNPYAIWVSEIMLQQTQVATVIPYYERFLRAFPTVRHLAEADLSRVLKIWEGLGYYSRARNLHKASRIVSNHFAGRIPDTEEDLLGLPGIGRYTAGAILSIAYNREAPILDGNVRRVLSRLFAVKGGPRNKGAEEDLWRLSKALIPRGRASNFNQGLMELGSLLCTPMDPRCLLCPLRDFCRAKTSGDPEKFPAKKDKRKIPHIEAICAVIERDGRVFLRQRPPEGLLGGLWEFPNQEVNGQKNQKGFLVNYVKSGVGIQIKVQGAVGTFKQTFSHFKLTLHVYDCRTPHGKGKGKWVPVRDLHLFPMSRIHRRIANTILSKQNVEDHRN